MYTFKKNKDNIYYMNNIKKRLQKGENMKKSKEELMKFEIAQELGLIDKIKEKGWKGLTAKESGKIGGIMTKRKKLEKEKINKI